MPPRKTPTKPPKKIAPTPGVPGPTLLKRKVLTPAEVKAKATELQQKAAEAGKVVEMPNPKCVKIRYDYADGEIRYAEGRHAEVLASFLEECERTCIFNGTVAYDGPKMESFNSEDEFLAREQGGPSTRA